MDFKNSPRRSAVFLLLSIAFLIFLPYLMTTHRVVMMRLLHASIAAIGFGVTARTLVRDARISRMAVTAFCYGLGGYFSFANDFVEAKSSLSWILIICALAAVGTATLLVTFRSDATLQR